MPKHFKVPSSTTYLPAPTLSSLQPANAPTSSTPLLAPTQLQQSPVIYPPVPPGSISVPAQPGAEFTADPIRLKTWGPFTYIHDPQKKERLRVNKDGYAIRRKSKTLLDFEADKSAGKLQITLEYKEESYGTQLVETMPDGAVRRTWVTSLVVTTWETERDAGSEELEDGEDNEKSGSSDDDESVEESSSEDSGDSGQGKWRGRKDGKKSKTKEGKVRGKK
ncbi:hypothetical protein MMC26_003695 [Xylographa opegraphella]|nr:hypothetical protein [Xylographa opegraphella]